MEDEELPEALEEGLSAGYVTVGLLAQVAVDGQRIAVGGVGGEELVVHDGLVNLTLPQGCSEHPRVNLKLPRIWGSCIVSFDGVLRTAALTTAMRASDVRQEKVDAIRESLDDGTYVIDNHKIAAKLVQDERAIFGK